MQSLRNHFLLAMPHLEDPNFAGSLSYLCDHDENGTMGIIVNHPLELTLDVLLERGFRVSGPEEKVSQFTTWKELLSTERLGPIRSDMVLGRLSEAELQEIDRLYLDISTVKLQDLFIRLTEDKEGVE